jgi:hypothetical protein
LKKNRYILEIDDFNVIVEVVHLCGGKHRLIPSPFANEKNKPVINVVKFVRTYVFFLKKKNIEDICDLFFVDQCHQKKT